MPIESVARTLRSSGFDSIRIRFSWIPTGSAWPGRQDTAAQPGTYAGLVEKVPYLQDLGVTAVELLPIFAFDQQDGPAGLGNYWGYAPLSFFAPHDGYSSRRDPLD